MGELKRNAARIGVVQTNDDRAGPKRRDERVDAKLGDDHSIDDADRGADHDDDERRERYRQLIEAEKPDKQQAAEARHVTDAEIKIARNQRNGEAARDDGANRHVVEDIPEVPDRRERAGLGYGK